MKHKQSRKQLRRALEALVDHIDDTTCHHPVTYRGGSIWTICGECGAKWADDEAGFVPYTDPPALAAARTLIEEHRNDNGKTDEERRIYGTGSAF